MADAGVELTAIAPTASLRYLLGFAPMGDERACMLLVSADGVAGVIPNLNSVQVTSEVPELEIELWKDDAGPERALAEMLERIGASGSVNRFAVDPEMRADHLLLLQAALPQAQTVSASVVITPLRERKDANEIAALQRSSDVTDRAVEAAFAALRPGITEAEVAEVIAQAFAAHGSRGEFSLVGGGPNGALAHVDPGPREMREGDAVVIDIGGDLDGYLSDITRMAFIGEPTERYHEIHAIVEAAVQAGMAASKPGATCAEVDAAARDVIEDAGYGEYFTHRTGHGLGLSIHEPPWIMAGNDLELAPGHVYSIEPGIYLPGEFGLRLEEIVHVTETGCERFSSLPRDVHVVA
jgi:Xaa-Pro aminopeptidase